MPPWPTIHDVEPKLTIEPPPASAMAGATACAAKNWWRRFTAKRSSQYSGVTRLDRVPLVVGRVVDQHADRPEPRLRLGHRRAQRRDVAQVAREEQRRGQAAAGSSRRAPSEASRWISTNATRARWAQKCSTMEAPMPLPPPVTNTTRSSRLGYVADRIMAPPAPTLAQVSARARLRRESDGSDHPARGRRRGRAGAGGRRRGHPLLARARRGDARVAAPDAGRGAARRQFDRAAAFPLVPYSNRIRAGRFSFRGRAVVEPLNRPPERHAIHGHGWQARWQPTDVRGRRRASSTAIRPAPGRGPITPRSGSGWRRRA